MEEMWDLTCVGFFIELWSSTEIRKLHRFRPLTSSLQHIWMCVSTYWLYIIFIYKLYTWNWHYRHILQFIFQWVFFAWKCFSIFHPFFRSWFLCTSTCVWNGKFAICIISLWILLINSGIFSGAQFWFNFKMWFWVQIFVRYIWRFIYLLSIFIATSFAKSTVVSASIKPFSPKKNLWNCLV